MCQVTGYGEEFTPYCWLLARKCRRCDTVRFAHHSCGKELVNTPPMEQLAAVFSPLSIHLKVSPAVVIAILSLWVLGLIILWDRRKTRRVFERLVSLSSHSAIPTFRSTLPQISNELTRARRTQRTLSILLLSLETAHLLTNRRTVIGRAANRNGNGKFRIDHMPTIALVIPQASYVLRNTIRESDILACGPAPGEFILALAETNRDQALRFVQRLQKLVTTGALTPLKAGIAEFPGDGLTIEDLVISARSSAEFSLTFDSPAISAASLQDGSLPIRREAM